MHVEFCHSDEWFQPDVTYSDIGGCDQQKQEIREAVELPLTHFDLYKQIGIDPPRGVLLYGPPGTGKTMMVNAAVNWLGKKVLLVDMQKLSKSRDSSERSAIAELFQEAELSDAVLFFDECEAVFRERGTVLNTLLTSIERFSGLVFLATNKPLDIDEAMHRRISKVYMFAAPNSQQRLQLWQSLTAAGLKFHSEVDLFRISLQCVPPLALLHST